MENAEMEHWPRKQYNKPPSLAVEGAFISIDCYGVDAMDLMAHMAQTLDQLILIAYKCGH